MDTNDLITFITVYEYQSINKAAKALFISPQAISKTIAKIETELEVTLFERSHMGMTPTIYGKSLAKNANEIITTIKGIKEKIKYPEKDLIYNLNLTTSYGVIAYLSVDFISDFHKRYTYIHLNVTEGNDINVESLLLDGDCEVGILGGPVDMLKYDAKFFTSHKHCLVINKKHRLANKKSISYKDLDNEKIALEGRQFRPFHNNMNRFLKAGITPQIVMETSEIDLTHHIAAKNQGIGLSVDFAAMFKPYENTVILPFEDEGCTWDTYIVTKKGRKVSEAADIFIKFALEWLEEHKDTLFKWEI